MGRWGIVDFSEIEALRDRLAEMAEHDYDTFCREAAKELAARLLALVIKRTPVGNAAQTKQSLRMLDEGVKRQKVTFASGETTTILRRGEAAIQRYWADYLGGTLRRGWTAKSEAEAAAGQGSPSGVDAVSYAQSLTVTKAGAAYEIEVINPVLYASYVEFGHRQQPGRYVPALGKSLKRAWVPGRFMLTISEAELQAASPPLLEKMLNEFLARCCNGT